jgi:ankyrin repeat protein
MNRKRFLTQTALTVAASAVLPVLSFGRQRPSANEPLPAEKVKEFVGAGHNNLTKVKAMLAEMPTLIYASWDLNNGDFETALEGAGHVGNKEIANYLIERGARTNLFVLTMLGKTALVKAYLDLFPQYLTARGPHGFTLLHHAQRGGEEAKELFDYLQSNGLKEMRAAL